ncbi:MULTISPECIES: APC family permease [unclassified Acidiplasma]|uniref:APC family permease n=1 Tax=unclassified Acidiplasma TaxID=2641301 RepID=UPI0005DF5290|nr:APC family permease [Acidiplasma sp. MBA-1]KJE49880.1 hypothetical protein TZ01_01995 [Acidiplasma sp. MBA-1]
MNSDRSLKPDQVGLWHDIFQSFSHVAPAAEVAILITGTALVAEGSTPLVFLLAPLIVLLWLNTNYQFSGKISSSGGYSAFSRAGLGKTAGDLTGWLFFFNEFLTYTGFALLSFAAFIFLISPKISSITYIWIPIMLIPLIFTTVFVYRGVRVSLNYAVYTGIIETLVLTIGAIIIIIKVGTGNTLTVFTAKPVGNDFSIIGLGLLFGLYSYGGSGSVIALGEESREPKRLIKKAILYGWLIVVIPLALNAYALTVGWGLNNISSFGSSPDPGLIEYFTFLGPFGGWLFAAIVLNSFLDFGIAINNSLTRMLYYLSRDSNILPSYLSETHKKYGTPYKAILTTAVFSFIIALISGLIFGPFIGALVIEGAASIAFMLQHAIATLSLPVYTKREKEFHIFADLIIPAIAIIFIGFAIFSTVYPVPAFPLNLPAYMVGVWILIGLILIIILKKFSSQKIEKVAEVK